MSNMVGHVACTLGKSGRKLHFHLDKCKEHNFTINLGDTICMCQVIGRF